MTKPYKLYRYFNSRGRLLYVGISMNPKNRNSYHRCYADWFVDAVRFEVSPQEYDTKQEARAAEDDAIEDEKPKHNIIGKGHRIICKKALKRREQKWKERLNRVLIARGLRRPTKKYLEREQKLYYVPEDSLIVRFEDIN